MGTSSSRTLEHAEKWGSQNQRDMPESREKKTHNPHPGTARRRISAVAIFAIWLLTLLLSLPACSWPLLRSTGRQRADADNSIFIFPRYVEPSIDLTSTVLGSFRQFSILEGVARSSPPFRGKIRINPGRDPQHATRTPAPSVPSYGYTLNFQRPRQTADHLNFDARHLFPPFLRGFCAKMA
ncbi:hypothetical protein BDP81DRAFT_432869 [Colletotrichum phormii]|uniref:Uncharacterized protein n=1 Tax=Colletotrichum phormii TaxID=359342 RepID=A0AAJ0ED93_9PEZI|nr:uncharacterized protein BDP81DRAFT_432869 [Colletotrichum phormii]KAK1634463.1 hypothetical protein BDP81DRAFT_432869 [Colletotrichum phormii]